MYEFTSWYVWHFITVLLVIGLLVLGSVCYFLFDHTQKELRGLEKELVSVAKEDQDTLQKSLDEVLYPDHANYLVEIMNKEGTIARSRGWNQLEGEVVPVLWFEQLRWNEEEGLVYKSEVTYRTSGTIQINVLLDDEMELLEVIFQILFYTGLLSLVVGSYLIYRLTKRSLRPLLRITDSVEQMRESKDLQQRIPVPDHVHELNELATTFNHLLEQLEEQFEREKSFVSNASHELRTPLTAFRGHLNLLKRWGKNKPEVLEQSIQALDQESERMERIMTQMLTIARNEHTEMERQTFSLTALIDNVTSQIQPPDTVQLEKELQENVNVKGDEEQIRQVAVILLENAIRYTKEGKVCISLQQNDSEIVLRVTDTGVGIPKEEQEKVFHRFYRVDKNRSRETGGTGLGLSIAKELVENHQGTIHVESEDGAGSTFIVRLPL